MISYAQNFEDVLLERCFRDVEAGFYVDAGAWDPVLDSVTKHFYNRGWSGINIEPSREFAAKLIQDRARDLVLPAAAGESEGSGRFFELSESRLSTLSEATLAHLARFDFDVQETTTAIVTLRRICEIFVGHRDIHFLKIDVEGMERAVIAGGDWRAFRPWVVVVEATVPYSNIPAWDEWEPLLLESEYTFAVFDGLSRFYVRNESAHLLEHFRTPPNCTDMFIPFRVAELEKEISMMKELNQPHDESHHAAGSYDDGAAHSLAPQLQKLLDGQADSFKAIIDLLHGINFNLTEQNKQVGTELNRNFGSVSENLRTLVYGQEDSRKAVIDLLHALSNNVADYHRSMQASIQTRTDRVLAKLELVGAQETVDVSSSWRELVHDAFKQPTAEIIQAVNSLREARVSSTASAAAPPPAPSDNHRDDVNRLQKEIERLQSIVSAQREEYRIAIDQLGPRLNESVTQNASLRQEAERLRGELGAVRASYSWRITGPLRAVFGLFVTRR